MKRVIRLVVGMLFLTLLVPLLEQSRARASDNAVWLNAAPMNNGSLGGIATVLHNGKVLFTGGYAEVYDPISNSWNPTGPMATTKSRGVHTATLLPDGRVFVTGGYDPELGMLASAEIYDPATNSWSPAASMSVARSGHCAILLSNGKVLVAGGYGGHNGYTTVSSAELYDPATNTWEPTGSMERARKGFVAVKLRSGKVLVAGSDEYDVEVPNEWGWFDWVRVPSTNTVEIYDPASGRWSSASPMSKARDAAHTGTMLPFGKVLVAGTSWWDEAGTAEIYDPNDDTWTPTPNMTETRMYHSATLLGNGKVLVAGGYRGAFPFNSAELYDPSDNTWTATAPMITGRMCQGAALLPDNRVLVAGGQGREEFSTLALASAEIYVPDSGTNTPSGTDVDVSLLNSSGRLLTLTFDNVNSSGKTSFIQSTTGPIIPKGYRLGGDPPVFYDIETTAEYAGSIEVCIPYHYGAYDHPQLFHYENGSWVNITTENIANNTVCGKTTSLSPFAILEPTYAFEGFLPPLKGAVSGENATSTAVAAIKANSTIPVKMRLSLMGAPVTDGVHTITVQKFDAVTTWAAPIDATPADAATAGNVFRLTDPLTGQWQYNLDTKGMSEGGWQIKVRLSDGSVHTTNIELK